MRHKLTDIQKDEAALLYSQGQEIADLARKYSVSRQSMRQVIGARTRIRIKGVEYKNPALKRNGATYGSQRSRRFVSKAIASGKLKNPGYCSECKLPDKKRKNGASYIEAHHDDYNNPLDVRWLCKKCHFEWHRHHTPIPYRGAE